VTEVIVAVFESSLAAEAAVQDLEVARIPSAVVERLISESVVSEDIDALSPGKVKAWPTVKVVVDEMHADAVTGILRQYGRLNMEMRAPGGRPAPTRTTRAPQRFLGLGSRFATAFT
jgi:hypothetical protein